MRADDIRRELNAAFSRAPLATRRRTSLADGIRQARFRWAAAVAASLVAAVLLAVVVMANVRTPRLDRSGAVLGTSSSPRALQSFDATPPPESALPPFVCTSEAMGSGSSNRPVAFIVGLTTAARPGYDRLTVWFNQLPGASIGLSTQPSRTFTTLPNRNQVTLAGRNGILLTIEDADSHSSYRGPTQIVTGYSSLQEVRLIEDSGGVVQLALGIGGPACYRAVLLNNPDRLIIDVRTP